MKMHRLSKMHLLQIEREKITSYKGKNCLKGKDRWNLCLYKGTTQKIQKKNQKYKSSSWLIPDTRSTDEHLKRADLQTFIWRQCMKNIIEYPDPIDRGWRASTEGFCPFWFSCEQISASITDKNQNIKTGRSMFHK